MTVLNRTFYLIGSVILALWTQAGTVTPGSTPLRPAGTETLRSVRALPPHLVGQFQDPLAFERGPDGQYFVFDRRGHTVYGVDAGMTRTWPIVQVGHEAGRIIQPIAFDVDADGAFAIADAPGGTERIQMFAPGGSRIAGFTLRTRSESRVQLDGLALNGISSLHVTDERTVLLNLPETGALVTEYDISGRVVRTVGQLRPTGHESDEQLHLAFNAGVPLPVPGGGLYFVFQTGEPRFRRYDAAGRLLFERVVQGRELDQLVQSQPTRWPRRVGLSGREIPVVTPVVRAAAIDPQGNLWVSLTLGYSYVYDSDGEKTRTVQFRGAGLIRPSNLTFTPDGELLVAPGCYIFKP